MGFFSPEISITDIQVNIFHRHGFNYKQIFKYFVYSSILSVSYGQICYDKVNLL